MLWGAFFWVETHLAAFLAGRPFLPMLMRLLS